MPKKKPAKSKYSADWKEKAEDFIRVADQYYWMAMDEGQILCDPCPGEEITDEYSTDPILIVVANEYRGRRNEPLLHATDWREAAEELGFSEYEAKVVLVTCNLDALGLEETPTWLKNGRTWNLVELWSGWFRTKLEDTLLGDLEPDDSN